MKDTTIIRRNPHLIIDGVDEEVIVFNEETQNTHILNEIAGFILKRADNIMSQDLVKLLYSSLSDDDQKNISIDKVSSDCNTFINELCTYQLITTEDVG